MPAANFGVTELKAFMEKHRVQGDVLLLEVPTPTVETAAQAVRARPEQIIKSILFVVDDQPVLAIACGTATINRRPIADFFGVGKKRVKLAVPEVVLEVSGYEVGAMPPFGHRQALTTLLDLRLLDLPVAYAGGGAENALVRLDPHDILRVTGANVLDLLG